MALRRSICRVISSLAAREEWWKKKFVLQRIWRSWKSNKNRFSCCFLPSCFSLFPWLYVRRKGCATIYIDVLLITFLFSFAFFSLTKWVNSNTVEAREWETKPNLTIRHDHSQSLHANSLFCLLYFAARARKRKKLVKRRKTSCETIKRRRRNIVWLTKEIFNIANEAECIRVRLADSRCGEINVVERGLCWCAQNWQSKDKSRTVKCVSSSTNRLPVEINEQWG